MDLNKFYQTTSKETLFYIALNFAMLQADENEAIALEILENEKDLLKVYK